MKTTLITGDGKTRSYSSQLGRFQSPDEMPCLRCGVCCTRWQPLLDDKEVAAVARGLGIPLDVFYRDHTERYPVKRDSYIFKRTGKACTFLRYEGNIASCAIHAFRPEACRNWVPDLSRRECHEGLRLRSAGRLLLPTQLGIPQEDLDRWYRLLAARNIGAGGQREVIADEANKGPHPEGPDRRQNIGPGR